MLKARNIEVLELSDAKGDIGTFRVVDTWNGFKKLEEIHTGNIMFIAPVQTATIAMDKVERNHRFLEESLELVQSLGCTKEEAHQLVDYTFNRPVGDPKQEVGGVAVTLAALGNANFLDVEHLGEVELERVWAKIEQIRAKKAAKPKFGPLPADPEPKLVPEHIAMLLEAYDFGQFGDDFDQPLAKPIRANLRKLLDEIEKKMVFKPECYLAQLNVPIVEPEDLMAEIAKSGGPKMMDRNRPYTGQAHTDQGVRGQQPITGLTLRDLNDCFIRAVLLSACHLVPKLYDEACKGENAKLNGGDLYGFDLDALDPIAIGQNLSCEVERVMGIFPNIPGHRPEGK